MFCRFCGAAIGTDSVFCAKCGKRLDHAGNPRAEKIVQTLGLKTPYPYFALVVIAFVSWGVWPKAAILAYSQVKWTMEQDKVLDLPEEDLYQQSLSLVLENVGSVPVRDIPIDLVARIEPQKTADILVGVLGRRLHIMMKGRALPLTIFLADPIDPGAKRRYFMEAAITAKAPFKVTYEVRHQGRDTVLASRVVER